MLHRASRLSIALALACSLGLHWAFLQSFAWTNMLVGNLGKVPLRAALEQTFDGRHPCALCKVVTAGKKSEQKAEYSLTLQKLEGIPQAARFTIFPPERVPDLPSSPVAFGSVTYAPPRPPPRDA